MSQAELTAILAAVEYDAIIAAVVLVFCVRVLAWFVAAIRGAFRA